MHYYDKRVGGPGRVDPRLCRAAIGRPAGPEYVDPPFAMLTGP
jgi:hypothetical protein